MTEDGSGARRPGQLVQHWWAQHLGRRETGVQRGLAARLRRGNRITVLCQPEVHRLAEALREADVTVAPDRLVMLVRLLAELRETSQRSLPRLLGQGSPPAYSAARFERLMRAEGEEMEAALRRALPTVGYTTNIAALGEALLFWGDKVRTRWCFDYYGAEAPRIEDISA